MEPYLIEIATTDFSTTQSAVAGGADRIELCADLGDGGTTQSPGTIRQCREKFEVALFPIIRPRGGDFLYSAEEFAIMRQDILFCRSLGCEGVVIGLLLPDGRIDLDRTARLVEAAYPMEVTFHRAFDRCLDPFEALEQLTAIGCSRILTSGQQPTAPEGAGLIRKLVEAAAGRIILMPGSGVRNENIRDLAQQTGATEFHSSLRSRKESNSTFRHPSFATDGESYTNPAVDAAAVQAMRQALIAE